MFDASFDDLVGNGEEVWRDGETERFRSLEIDDQLIFCRKLHRQVSRLFPLENAIDVGCPFPKRVDRIGPVRDQAAVSCKITQWIKRRKAIPRRQPQNLIAIVDRDGVWRDD